MALGFPHSGEVPILEPWICHSSRPGSRGGPPGPAKLWPSGNQWGAFAWGRTDTNPISRQQNVGNSPIFPPSSSNLGLEGYVFQFFGTGEFFSILQLCPCRDPIGHLRFISAMCEQWRVRPKWCQQKSSTFRMVPPGFWGVFICYLGSGGKIIRTHSLTQRMKITYCIQKQRTTDQVRVKNAFRVWHRRDIIRHPWGIELQNFDTNCCSESKIDPEWIHAVYHVSSKDYQEIPNCPCGSCALWWLIPDDTSNFQAIRVLCVCLPPFHGYPTCFLLSFPSKVLHPIVSHQHLIQYSFRGYNCPHLPQNTAKIPFGGLLAYSLLVVFCSLSFTSSFWLGYVHG